MTTPLEIELKKRHGSIYKIHVNESDVDIYFKLMTKAEYDSFTSLCEGEYVTPAAEDYILDFIVVHPDKEALDNLYAGEVTAIVSEIALKSGFYDIKNFAEELTIRRALAETLSEQIIAFISKAFPTYTIEQLEAKNYKELARLLAVAEIIMGQRLDVTGEEKQPIPEAHGNVVSRRHEITPEDESRLADEAKERATSLMQKYKQRTPGR
jgi:hypothetical protein